jgi:hypothetical protein
VPSTSSLISTVTTAVALQAAKVLIGAMGVSGGGGGVGGSDMAVQRGGGRQINLLADQWRQFSDYFGKLKEHPLEWVERACIASVTVHKA